MKIFNLPSCLATVFLFQTALSIGIGQPLPTLHIGSINHDSVHVRAAPPFSSSASGNGSLIGAGTFDQQIDHADPGLGTFHQRFWYSYEFWKGPGSPIVVYNPGEQDATDSSINSSFLTDTRLPGRFAKAIGGAVIVLEHRYWGESSPVPDLSWQNLQYLTVENALEDLRYFANHFVPPFDTSGQSHPRHAPWILCGGSYSGALAGWEAAAAATATVANDTCPSSSLASPFWAYYSTSGVVEAIGNYWEYFDIVRKATPANCSADLMALMQYADNILDNGSEEQKTSLKAKFLLQDLADGDFANVLSYGQYMWQNTHFFSEDYLGFNMYHRFCDYVENVWPNSTNPVPGSEGVGVSKALDGYAKWWTEFYLPGYCESLGTHFNGTHNVGCFDFLNASSPMYQSIAIHNTYNRPWDWMKCNEVGWLLAAPPPDRPSIVSRHANYDYFIARCNIMFPESAGGFGLSHSRTTDPTNTFTGGWSTVDHPGSKKWRVIFANGELDPWRSASISSEARPGGPLVSNIEAGIHVTVIEGGVHSNDLYGENWNASVYVEAIAKEHTDIMVGWVAEFYNK